MIEYCLIVYLKCVTLQCKVPMDEMPTGSTKILMAANRSPFKDKNKCETEFKNNYHFNWYGHTCWGRDVNDKFDCTGWPYKIWKDQHSINLVAAHETT